MPGVRNSCSALAVVRRPDTVATTRNRTCQGTEGETWNKVEVTGAVGPKVGNFLEEEWIKASWKKGECREEIKLVADASGLGFDDARIVVREDCSWYCISYTLCGIAYICSIIPVPLSLCATEGFRFY